MFINETSYANATLLPLVRRAVIEEIVPSERQGVIVRVSERHLKGRGLLVDVAIRKREVRVRMPIYNGPDWREWLSDLAPGLLQALSLGCARLVKRELILRNAERFRSHPLTITAYADAAKLVQRMQLRPYRHGNYEARILRYELLRRRLRDRRAHHQAMVKLFGKRMKLCSQRMGEIRFAMRKNQKEREA